MWIPLQCFKKIKFTKSVYFSNNCNIIFCMKFVKALIEYVMNNKIIVVIIVINLLIYLLVWNLTKHNMECTNTYLRARIDSGHNHEIWTAFQCIKLTRKSKHRKQIATMYSMKWAKMCKKCGGEIVADGRKCGRETTVEILR